MNISNSNSTIVSYNANYKIEQEKQQIIDMVNRDFDSASIDDLINKLQYIKRQKIRASYNMNASFINY
jgi:hypothetical protein